MACANWRTTALCGLLLGVTAAARADNPPPYGNGFAPPTTQPVWQPPYPQYAPTAIPQTTLPTNQPPTQNQQPFYAYPPAVNPPAQGPAPACAPPPGASSAQYPAPQAGWGAPNGPPPGMPFVPPGPTAPQGPPSASPPDYGLPQPRAAAENVPPPQSMNGTLRDEGDYVVIEVNGQQLRLAKSALAQQQAPNSAAVHVPVGSVHGRLLQNGEPVVNCAVVIVPMHKDGATDEGGVRQPLSTVTDAYGIFGFENAPVGSYKLTWLPAGTTQWIRRIEMKPDVFVHEGQETALKDIRSSMRTIN